MAKTLFSKGNFNGIVLMASAATRTSTASTVSTASTASTASSASAASVASTILKPSPLSVTLCHLDGRRDCWTHEAETWHVASFSVRAGFRLFESGLRGLRGHLRP